MAQPTFRNMYFKDDGSHRQYISGLILPTDDDGVVRNKTFIRCTFHPACGEVKFVNCDFVDCDGVNYLGLPFAG